MKQIYMAMILVSALALTACSNRSDTQPSVVQVQAIGDSLANELEASTASLTASDVVGQGVATQSALVPPACVSFTPNPLVDSDNDGIPNSATYTFNCSKSRPSGGSSKLTGQTQISDPGAGFSLNLSNLKTEIKNGDGSLFYAATRNGSRSATGSSTQLTLAHDLSVLREVTGFSSASIGNKLNVVFTAASGSTIVQNQPLPSGTLSISGSYGWVRDSDNFSFSLSTPTPLNYDKTCSSDLKIIGGVLKATLSGSGNQGYLRITFNACGVAPSVILFSI